jgi:hypothetical protein
MLALSCATSLLRTSCSSRTCVCVAAVALVVAGGGGGASAAVLVGE